MRAALLGATSLVLVANLLVRAADAGELTSWAGVPISPIPYSSGVTTDYAHYVDVPVGSQPDINPSDTSAWTPAFVDNFATLSTYDANTGAGTWLVGSPNQINNETEFYPNSAQIAAVGSNPFTLNNGVLGINLAPLNPGYANDVQSGTQQWQSGRLDTSRIPGLYSEGGLLYIEVTAQVADSPYAWPAFWALAKDSVYPLEYDAMEVFGQPGTSYDSTIHYLSPNVSGNNTTATRVWTNGADLAHSFHVYGFLANRFTRTLSAYFDHHFVGSMPVVTDPQGFDKEVYLILNEATGGQVPSPAVGTAFPITFKVKQVAAYYNNTTAHARPVQGVQPEAAAYLASLAHPPSAAWTNAFDAMIVRAKNLGFFLPPHRPAHWWIFATDHETDAAVDLMNPAGRRLSMTGQPVSWTADRGFVGNGGRGWLDTGVQLAGIDPANYGMGAWITQSAGGANGGGLIGTTDPGNDLRLETTNDVGVVYDLGTQYGAHGENAPDTALGWFGLSTFADPGSPYADTVTMMARNGNSVASEQRGAVTPLPASDVLLMRGTDGAASVVLGEQWHQPRQILFRDQVLGPFLQAIGAN